MSARFDSYVGIEYSGAETPTSSLRGLRVYEANRTSEPQEVQPPSSPRKYWTRRGIAEWLVSRLSNGPPALVGIDHAFSFPIRYFEEYDLPPDWHSFLADFRQHWPTDEDHVYVDFVRHGSVGAGAARAGSARWRRLTEIRSRAKSVFHFGVPGSVAKSTHSGLPWLLYLRNRLGDRVHFWPLEGWQVPTGRSAIVEVYPALWSREFERGNRDDDQQDAFVAAAWLRRADLNGTLNAFLSPVLTPEERATAAYEGWILGVR